MTDIDPKSIPVLDDVIEDDADEPLAAEASTSEAVDLFSPASLIDDEGSQAEDGIDHAASLVTADSSASAGDDAEVDTVAGTDKDAVIEPVSELAGHSTVNTAEDESTLPEVDDLYQDDILNDPAAVPVAATVVEAEPAPEADPSPVPADAAQTAPSQQADINTAAVTEQIIDRLMPEIEQRLRVIIDLTLRENLRDRKQDD